MRLPALSIGLALLLTGCNTPTPKAPGADARIADAMFAATATANPAERRAVDAAMQQCLAHFRTGTYDTAALTAAGYQPYTPPLNRAGFRAVTAVEEGKLLDFGDVERDIKLFYGQKGALGARTGCDIVSTSALLPGAMTGILTDEGFTRMPDPRLRGGFVFEKGTESISYRGKHDMSRGTYEFAFRLNE